MKFGEYLTTLRNNAKLTNRELGKLAHVSHSFIAGLQSGRRSVGEHSARKIGVALGLRDKELDEFILRAIDTCTEKVLNIAKDFPADLINLLPIELRAAGISPEHVQRYEIQNDRDVDLYLNNGRKVRIETTVAYA